MSSHLARIEQVARAAPGTGLELREHLVDAAVIAVGGDEQPAEGMVRACWYPCKFLPRALVRCERLR